jgi:hypothetical protein
MKKSILTAAIASNLALRMENHTPTPTTPPELTDKHREIGQSILDHQRQHPEQVITLIIEDPEFTEDHPLRDYVREICQAENLPVPNLLNTQQAKKTYSSKRYRDIPEMPELKSASAEDAEVVPSRHRSAGMKRSMPHNRKGRYGYRAEIRTTEKIGRNAPCPCGSGKKNKLCCRKS